MCDERTLTPEGRYRARAIWPYAERTGNGVVTPNCHVLPNRQTPVGRNEPRAEEPLSVRRQPTLVDHGQLLRLRDAHFGPGLRAKPQTGPKADLSEHLGKAPRDARAGPDVGRHEARDRRHAEALEPRLQLSLLPDRREARQCRQLRA